MHFQIWMSPIKYYPLMFSVFKLLFFKMFELVVWNFWNIDHLGLVLKKYEIGRGKKINLELFPMLNSQKLPKVTRDSVNAKPTQWYKILLYAKK